MKKVIESTTAPAAIGPYSQAIIYGDLLFISGQLPLIPETMQFPIGGIKEQATQSLKNAQEILKKSNASLDTVIKTTCFLTDMSHFSQFNEVYTKFFNTEKPPARSCIEVAGLPKGALVEIEIIAYIQ
ncbi:TPA: RidA family protein [Raoultella ornithinolytica]|uniref:RidA family protein n=1 Tax=Raoultella ornithinolytica TaxID=54291 RepID=UPI00273DE702|nr:RidA family protein [Raoultella ornithinolytica]WLP48159.1 RidA family protein [Raoultella ornithinolytica]HEC2551407.1 RidA family protein [Raoultella ornithinolytica]HEC2604030.1 RidA family protein [Raoultella ornithinolytica]HEC2612145.1 RidA family protein [Raoultella ornithinolytica]